MTSDLKSDQAGMVDRLENFLGYSFKDRTLAWEAMQRTEGKGLLNGRTQQQNNRRLAALGDIVIYLILCQEWYSSNDSLKSWSKIRENQTSNKFFSKTAQNLNLDWRFVFPPPEQPKAGQKKKVEYRPMATLVEAIVGAVWLDSGRDPIVTREVLVELGIMTRPQVQERAQHPPKASLKVANPPKLLEPSKLPKPSKLPMQVKLVEQVKRGVQTALQEQVIALELRVSKLEIGASAK